MNIRKTLTMALASGLLALAGCGANKDKIAQASHYFDTDGDQFYNVFEGITYDEQGKKIEQIGPVNIGERNKFVNESYLMSSFHGRGKLFLHGPHGIKYFEFGGERK